MTRYQRALAMGCLLAALPLASTVWAQDPNQPIPASDGSVAAVMESSATVSMSNTGSPASKAEANEPPRVFSAAERARLATYKPMVAPGGQAESIIGTDNRIRVNPTTVYPYRAIALITFTTPSGNSRCSGWFINATTIATAGHCVHQGGGGSYYNRLSYRIYPGFNGNTAPYGSCTAKRLHTVNGWANGGSGADQYDYGAIKLNCSVGSRTGWFGYFWTTGSLLNFTTTVSGYPGDKPFTQWRSTDFVRVVQARRIFYKNDTIGGQSGSPVYVSWQLCFPCALAVHAYGTGGSAPFSTNNHGTRIVQAVFNNFNSWKNAP